MRKVLGSFQARIYGRCQSIFIKYCCLYKNIIRTEVAALKARVNVSWHANMSAMETVPLTDFVRYVLFDALVQMSCTKFVQLRRSAVPHCRVTLVIIR